MNEFDIGYTNFIRYANFGIPISSATITLVLIAVHVRTVLKAMDFSARTSTNALHPNIVVIVKVIVSTLMVDTTVNATKGLSVTVSRAAILMNAA